MRDQTKQTAAVPTVLKLAHDRGLEWIEQLIAHHVRYVEDLRAARADYLLAIADTREGSRPSISVLSSIVSDLNNVQRNCRLDLAVSIAAAISSAEAEVEAMARATHVRISKHSDATRHPNVWQIVVCYSNGKEVTSNHFFDSPREARANATELAKQKGVPLAEAERVTVQRASSDEDDGWQFATWYSHGPRVVGRACYDTKARAVEFGERHARALGVPFIKRATTQPA